jgi:hypothetical protein
MLLERYALVCSTSSFVNRGIASLWSWDCASDVLLPLLVLFPVHRESVDGDLELGIVAGRNF